MNKHFIEILRYHPDGKLWVKGFLSGDGFNIVGLHVWFGEFWYKKGKKGFAILQQYRNGSGHGVEVRLKKV